MNAPLPAKRPSSDVADAEVLPKIADHEFIRPIGKGAYGEVWLGRNAIGSLHAIKVVRRSTFPDDSAFHREFEGLRKFEPICRTHQGFVAILHVGERFAEGYFYYVMELADDARTGPFIDPTTYVARTLAHEIAASQRLSLETSLPISLSLASALAKLHEYKFIHRDIKPSNIIFVKGVPKFADIGLVTEQGKDVSDINTPPYRPPEGPGDATGDIFSLGKVFYQLFMGQPVKSFPEVLGAAEEFNTNPALKQLNNLILTACDRNPERRFQTANELHEALVSVTETVQGNRQLLEQHPRRAGFTTAKATRDSEGQPDASGERRPKARLSRRAALLIGGPIALGGAFLLGRQVRPEGQVPENPKEKLRKWQVLYDVLDDKLACFMGYVGTNSPNTKFLIYSRGTDKNWTDPAFRKRWVKEIEARFPALTNRISTMEIKIPQGRQRATFRNPETAEEMKTEVKRLLDLTKGAPTLTPADRPVVVLMDTTANRGVYDDENKGTPITNAEELKKQLQDLPVRAISETISIDSSNREWRGEQRVLDHHPSLVIFHRSAFFHPVNAVMGLGYPPSPSDPQQRWQER